MKMIVRIIGTICLISILLNLFSCGNRQEAKGLLEDDIAPDEVTLRSAQDVVFWNNYVYFSRKLYNEYGKVFGQTVLRQNLTTGEISSACQDPLCTHDTKDCPFFGGQTYFLPQVFGDEWMVIQTDFNFNYYEKGYVTDAYRILYNLKTGEWRRIFEIFNPDEGYDAVLFSNGTDLFNSFYSNEKVTDETGETYFPCSIYKHNLKTGKESVVYSSRYTINLLTVTQKNIFFFLCLPDDENRRELLKYYCYNMETGEVKSIADLIPDGTQVRFAYQNKFYSGSDNYSTASIINAKTGETTYPMGELSEDVIYIYVDENAAYYGIRRGYREKSRAFQKVYNELVKEASELTGEERVAKFKEIREMGAEFNSVWIAMPFEVWKTDLNGNNPELVLTVENFGGSAFSVYEGYFYFRYSLVDPETGLLDRPERNYKFSRINIATGELTVLEELADAQEEKSK